MHTLIRSVASCTPPAVRQAIRRLLRLEPVCLAQAAQNLWVFGEVFNEKRNVLIKEIPGYDCFYVHDSFLKQYANNALAFYSKVFWVWPRW